MGNFIMNYNSHPHIREAIKQSEKINARCERSISLYRLGQELEKRRISKQDFKEYLYRYASITDKEYIESVLPKLFDEPIANIDKSETFRITSGLR